MSCYNFLKIACIAASYLYPYQYPYLCLCLGFLVYIYIYNRIFWNSHNFPHQHNIKKKKKHNKKIKKFFKPKQKKKKKKTHKCKSFSKTLNLIYTLPSLSPTEIYFLKPTTKSTSPSSKMQTTNHRRDLLPQTHDRASKESKPTIPTIATNQHISPSSDPRQRPL